MKLVVLVVPNLDKEWIYNLQKYTLKNIINFAILIRKKVRSQLANQHVAPVLEILVGVALDHVQRVTKFQKFKKSTFWLDQKLVPLQNSPMMFTITSKHLILRWKLSKVILIQAVFKKSSSNLQLGWISKFWFLRRKSFHFPMKIKIMITRVNYRIFTISPYTWILLSSWNWPFR